MRLWPEIAMSLKRTRPPHESTRDETMERGEYKDAKCWTGKRKRGSLKNWCWHVSTSHSHKHVSAASSRQIHFLYRWTCPHTLPSPAGRKGMGEPAGTQISSSGVSKVYPVKWNIKFIQRTRYWSSYNLRNSTLI